MEQRSTFKSTAFDGDYVEVADEFDSDGDLGFMAHEKDEGDEDRLVYLNREETKNLRDHLTAVLGDGPSVEDFIEGEPFVSATVENADGRITVTGDTALSVAFVLRAVMAGPTR